MDARRDRSLLKSRETRFGPNLENELHLCQLTTNRPLPFYRCGRIAASIELVGVHERHG